MLLTCTVAFSGTSNNANDNREFQIHAKINLIFNPNQNVHILLDYLMRLLLLIIA